jgi:hypothetical protein
MGVAASSSRCAEMVTNTGERASSAGVARLVAFTVFASTAALMFGLGPPIVEGQRPHAFEYLYRTQEPIAAWLSVALVLLAAGAAALRGDPRGLVASLARRPHLFIAGATAAMAAGALLVYRAHPLSMDEYAPLFQARAFAAGALAGKAPPEMVGRLVPPYRWFIEASPDGHMVSAYWPGFALLLTPFVWLRVPWLLNPVLGGVSLYLMWWLARRTCVAEDAPGWVMLLAASSPAFTVTAISYYSMGAHLCASLAFAALLLHPTPRRLALAGAVGSVALVLHNPLPHVLFAIPFLIWLATKPDRWRNLSALAVGYLPGALLLGVGWLWVQCRVGICAEGAAHGSIAAFASELWQFAFQLPTSELLWARVAALLKLVLWAVPGLVPLAWWGARERARDGWWGALLGSAALTLLAYLFVPYNQGHGWGYRYFHSAWATLPLFGAAALSAPVPEREALRRTLFAACLASLLFMNGLRFAQVRSFISGHLAQIPLAPPGARFEVVFIHTDAGYYTNDLVQNDPFLRGPRWVLISRGRREDERWIQGIFPRARVSARNDVAEIWSVE